jgi:Flp pilus assembly pilin Flp
MWSYCEKFLAEESAISAVEYAAMLALIGAAIVAAMLGLGNAVLDDYSQAAAQIAG